ncbi:MAG: hypothetical protein IAE77_06640 [Prosthecobacter sp.]|jgi:uncharacterized protein (TIGR02646 family)|uniref:hypothetical protein n=1 Tax=Prosthecobacter sp. TaxID=1965333 RepID=UPI0019F001ED|nr:hypothetical protein [Prosthecobacter sp.]MBE2283120.1 hypothetical protein [Prosthecobacter sp.]
MIQLPALALEKRAARKLKDWQAEVNALASYAARVQAGKQRFKSRNTKRNATFNHVKDVLSQMCQGARRCSYCEDSVADEVEHIMPKDLYPEGVFEWDNYLYACGPCNGPKNSEFAVLAGAPRKLVTVTRPDGAPVTSPQAGSPALINPRTEDPLHFLFLDLLNTFAFDVRNAPAVTDDDRLRADYTLRVLHLNDRDYLVKARRTAFGTYRARLGEYVTQKQNGAAQAILDRHRDELLEVGHQTVWREMQRQQAMYPVLKALFDAAPEALAW